MDGNWNKWWVLPLAALAFLANLPRIVWGWINPPDAAPSQSRWDDLEQPTPEEEEEWRRLEKQQ